MENWPVENYKRAAAEAMAREADKTRRALATIISDANAHRVEMTKPGQPMPKPIEGRRGLASLPEYAHRYDRVLSEGQARISQIGMEAKQHARKDMTKPLPDEALKYLEPWDKYPPSVDELKGFMAAYGEYPQASQIVNSTAERLNLDIRALGRSEMQTEMIDSAEGLARAAANPDNAGMCPNGLKLEEALTARITGEGPTEADYSGRLFGRKVPLASGESYRIYGNASKD